jgi:plastocyanin
LVAPAAASATETTYTYTVPITVGGYEVQQAETFAPHPSEIGSITKMETDIVDDSGNPVPISRLMLHHIVFINISHPDRTCSSFLNWDNLSNLPGRERFYAAGEERSKVAMPPGYGYKTQNEPWGMLYMVMNHRATPDHAFIQYKVTVDDDPAIKPVHPYWLDANNCKADPQYTVPGTGGRGSTADNATDLIMPESGRIVAGSGHVHGGAKKLALDEPGCGNREIADSVPTWGLPDHPFYNVRPILHEPGPINMTAFTTPTGIPVNAGEQLRMHSLYDNSVPHMRVMGIMMIYVAPDPAVTSNCGPLPNDKTIIGTNQPGRPGPVPFTVPLTGLDANGQAVTINAPPGKLRKVKSGTTIQVGDRYFSRLNVKIKRKQRLRWEFNSPALHNLTLANGPVGFASPNLSNGRTVDINFQRAGTYRFFCSLHPVQMTERVVVRKKHKKHKKHKRSGHKKK